MRIKTSKSTPAAMPPTISGRLDFFDGLGFGEGLGLGLGRGLRLGLGLGLGRGLGLGDCRMHLLFAPQT